MKQFYRGQPVIDTATGDKYFYFDTIIGIDNLHVRVYDGVRKVLISIPLGDVVAQQHPIDRRVDFIKSELAAFDASTPVDTVEDINTEKIRVVLNSSIDDFLDFLEDVTTRVKRPEFLYFYYDVATEGLDSVAVQLEFYYEAK